MDNLYKDFFSCYSKLNYIHQDIIYSTLRKMYIPKKNLSFKFRIWKLFRSKENYGYNKLYQLLNDALNNSLTKKTYDSFMYRKELNSQLFNETCKILNVHPHDISRIEFTVQSNALYNIKTLFNSLNEKNKKAILHLATMLELSENHPEIFIATDDGEYDEAGNELPYHKLKRPKKKFQ